jgi:hypothetical protein
MNLDPMLTLALDACRAVKGGEVCYSWLDDRFKRQGVAPSHLKELAKRGPLVRVDGSRGGHRAYYRLNPAPTSAAVVHPLA